MELFYQLLERSKLTQELIGVRKYDEDFGFLCGYVVDYNDAHIRLQHYTAYGKPDGIILVQIASVKSIDFKDPYVTAMNYIITQSAKLDTQTQPEFPLTGDEGWQLEMLRQLEGHTDVIVSIEINGSQYYTGFVEEVSELDFVMKCVGKLGEDEGYTLYKMEDLSSIRVNDLDDRKKLMLYNWKKQKG